MPDATSDELLTDLARAAGALLLSTLMAVMSYQLIRGSLLDERERTAARAAYYNAAIVNTGIAGADPDIDSAQPSRFRGDCKQVRSGG